MQTELIVAALDLQLPKCLAASVEGGLTMVAWVQEASKQTLCHQYLHLRKSKSITGSPQECQLLPGSPSRENLPLCGPCPFSEGGSSSGTGIHRNKEPASEG